MTASHLKSLRTNFRFVFHLVGVILESNEQIHRQDEKRAELYFDKLWERADAPTHIAYSDSTHKQVGDPLLAAWMRQKHHVLALGSQFHCGLLIPVRAFFRQDVVRATARIRSPRQVQNASGDLRKFSR